MKAVHLAVLMIVLAGCQKEGPAEKAGRSIDQAAEKAGNAMDKAAKNVREAATPDKK